MIKVFNADAKVFTTNGEKILQPIKAVITKEDNGDYSLALEASINDKDYIKNGNIIVCDTQWGAQGFRVYNPQKKNNRITSTCKHVYFDTDNYLIEDSYILDGTCDEAIRWFNSHAEPTSPFIVSSNIGALGNVYILRKPLSEAISACIETYGGHLIRDNFNIQINSTIGQDNGVVIRYGKNLQEITSKEDWSKVTTKLMPVGKDGLLLPEKYITTQDIDTSSEYYGIEYDVPYCRSITFNQSHIEKTDEETEEEYTAELIADLRSQAIAYITENCIPKISYTIKALIEKITDVGDRIDVIDERFTPAGQILETHVKSLKYDAIQGRIIEVNFGTIENKLKNLIPNITTQTTNNVEQTIASEIQPQINSAIAEATAQMWGEMGNSYVLYENDRIILLDAIPKEMAQNCIMLNNKGVSFSSTGIDGEFIQVWSIDGVLNADKTTIAHFIADTIKGGILKIGSEAQEHSKIEIYDSGNALVGEIDENGIFLYTNNGNYIKINKDTGFTAYDKNNQLICWMQGDKFSTNKFTTSEIKIADQIKMLKIETTNNTGIGIMGL